MVVNGFKFKENSLASIMAVLFKLRKTSLYKSESI